MSPHSVVDRRVYHLQAKLRRVNYVGVATFITLPRAKFDPLIQAIPFWRKVRLLLESLLRDKFANLAFLWTKFEMLRSASSNI